MNWLEKHIRYFVIPGIQKIVQRKDFGPFKGQLRPASCCETPEGGMLYSFLRSARLDKNFSLSSATISLLKRFEYIEVLRSAEGYNSLIKRESHLEFAGTDIVHAIIKNSVKDLKRRLEKDVPMLENKVVLLGRDVWLWAVLGAKMGLRFVYDPRISRNVASNEAVFFEVLNAHKVMGGDIIFDTGFGGTIHRRAEAACAPHNPSATFGNLMLSATDKKHQQFPNNGLARNRALFIEYLPKYFQTATVEGGYGYLSWGRDERSPKSFSLDDIRQPFSSLNEFVASAALTVWAWNYESPAWIPGPKVKREELNLFSKTRRLFW